MAQYKDLIHQVAQFHEVFRIGNETSPNTRLPIHEYELRHRLFEEENNEYLDACKSGNLTEVADALGDLLYILNGTILKHGLQHHIESVFEEIHRSNMSKLDESGQPIFREDGKVMKSANYFKPNIDRYISLPLFKIEKFGSNDDAFKKACAIREVVFVQEQEVAPEEEYDEFESTSVHYLLSQDDKPIATARWRITEKGIKLERFAVLKEYRGSGAGMAILQTILADVRHLGRTVYLHAQLHALDFYKKAGFKAVGDLFSEANIEHYKMTLPATL